MYGKINNREGEKKRIFLFEYINNKSMVPDQVKKVSGTMYTCSSESKKKNLGKKSVVRTRTTTTTTTTMRDAMVRAFSSGAYLLSSHSGNLFLRRMMIGRGAPAASAPSRSQRRSMSSGASPPKTTTTRVSETRVYYPGQTYEPTELEGSFASAAPSASQKTRRVLKKGKDLDALVARSIDWKDAKTLSTRFVSETGKILPRRQTGLGAKTHRLVAKNIKIARIMGVLPFTDRLPQFARRRKNPYS